MLAARSSTHGSHGNAAKRDANDPGARRRRRRRVARRTPPPPERSRREDARGRVRGEHGDARAPEPHPSSRTVDVAPAGAAASARNATGTAAAEERAAGVRAAWNRSHAERCASGCARRRRRRGRAPRRAPRNRGRGASPTLRDVLVVVEVALVVRHRRRHGPARPPEWLRSRVVGETHESALGGADPPGGSSRKRRKKSRLKSRRVRVCFLDRGDPVVFASAPHPPAVPRRSTRTRALARARRSPTARRRDRPSRPPLADAHRALSRRIRIRSSPGTTA